jgi:hypothetical protein
MHVGSGGMFEYDKSNGRAAESLDGTVPGSWRHRPGRDSLLRR